MNYLELLQLMAPETVIALTALIVLGADLVALQDVSATTRTAICATLTAGGCLVALFWIAGFSGHIRFMNGLLVLNPATGMVKATLLVLAAFTAVLSVPLRFTRHIGEYFALVLIGTVGMMVLVSSEDLLLIFLGLELSSVALYLLTAIEVRNPNSVEAALKYFLFGGVAAAFTLFGFSLLYGISGSANLSEIARAIAEQSSPASTTGGDPLLALAMVLTLVGFAFKIAAAPFHLWAPDVYQGAPAPSAALVASGSKVAGFYVLAKVALSGFAGLTGGGAELNTDLSWTTAVAAVATVSMLLGNLAAIVQSSLRRLLAYSAIAHAGYMLLAILSPGAMSFPSLLYYAITYAISSMGAFAFVSWFEMEHGSRDVHLSSLAGLSRRAPIACACMLVFVLSLAGIPPLPGFFAKFYVFSASLRSGFDLLWLVLLALAMSSVSLYYYLQILKQMYVREPSSIPSTAVPRVSQATLCVLALLVILAGCFPEWLVARLGR